MLQGHGVIVQRCNANSGARRAKVAQNSQRSEASNAGQLAYGRAARAVALKHTFRTAIELLEHVVQSASLKTEPNNNHALLHKN
jgi:hypothetical protein